ncbi:MAG: hypothetical protein JJT94_02345 [Bernardetiaceae bacterium]|nr:hypothetical protein [Bernardetiaceae bacterium]
MKGEEYGQDPIFVPKPFSPKISFADEDKNVQHKAENKPQESHQKKPVFALPEESQTQQHTKPQFEVKNKPNDAQANSPKQKIDFGSDAPSSTYNNSETQEAKHSELLEQMRKSNLQIAKLSKEVKALNDALQPNAIFTLLEDIANHLKRNTLYMSKLERKYTEVSPAAQHGEQKKLDELFNIMRTNNLYLSKLERRIQNLDATATPPPTQQPNDDMMAQIRSNTLQLAKLERKINELLYQKKTENGTPLNGTKPLQATQVQSSIAKRTQASNTEIPGDILNNLIDAQLNQTAENPEAQLTQIQTNELLLRNVKSNNLHLARLSQQIAKLLERL